MQRHLEGKNLLHSHVTWVVSKSDGEWKLNYGLREEQEIKAMDSL